MATQQEMRLSPKRILKSLAWIIVAEKPLPSSGITCANAKIWSRTSDQPIRRHFSLSRTMSVFLALSLALARSPRLMLLVLTGCVWSFILLVNRNEISCCNTQVWFCQHDQMASVFTFWFPTIYMHAPTNANAIEFTWLQQKDISAFWCFTTQHSTHPQTSPK